MINEEFNKMTIEEKANFYFQRFKADFDNYNCEEKDFNCIYNRYQLSILNNLNKLESEPVLSRYEFLCKEYENRFKN